MNLVADAGDRIAFLGPNGAGKSTLFRVLMGMEKPNSGKASIGPTITTGYFAQNQADTLDLEDTVIGVIQKASTTESYVGQHINFNFMILLN